MTGSRILANVTAVAIGERALLIEGAPGSGKSSLALALIDRGAMLIGDDGITIEVRDARVMLSPPPRIAGLLEVRGVGLVELPTASAPLALVLALDPVAARHPLELERRDLAGIAVPILPFAPGDAVQAPRAEYALEKHGLVFPPPAGGTKQARHG